MKFTKTGKYLWRDYGYGIRWQGASEKLVWKEVGIYIFCKTIC